MGGAGAESLVSGTMPVSGTLTAVTAITNALPAGTNLLGKVGIDQTTPGTTNKVSIGTDGTVAVTGSVAVTNAGLTNLDVALSTRLKPADTLAGITTVGAVTSITNPVAVTQSGTWSTRTQDGSGNAINSLSAGTGMNGLLIAQGPTNYVISTSNATTAQLASGATFTGSIESGNSEPSVSVIMTCDQPGILTINQYITSSAGSIVSSVQFATAATLSGNCFARSFTLNGNFVNVTWKNTGSVATTTLQIDTAYGNIQATTNLLNNPSSINEVSGVALALGRTSMAASLPVTIASDQGAVSVSQSPQITEVLRAILIEMRVLNQNVNDGLLAGRLNQNLDIQRNDEDISFNLNG